MDFAYPIIATLSIRNESWLPLVIALVLVALLVLGFSYRHSNLQGANRWLAFTLKALGFILLALYLLDPVIHDEQPKQKANDIAIVTDNSSSLNLTIPPSTEPLSTSVKDAIASSDASVAPHWIESLDETFRVHHFQFDHSLRRVGDYQNLTFDQPFSQLGHTLSSIQTRFKNHPLAATILLTDGNATDEKKLQQWIKAAQGDSNPTTPIYPVVIGDQLDAPHDLSIGPILSETSEFEDGRVSLSFTASSASDRKQTAQIVVRNAEGTELAAETVIFPKGSEGTVPVKMRLSNVPVGLSFLTVSIEDDSEKPRQELTIANNTREVVADKKSGPYRILYVSGRPNWEFKFLRRALSQDADLELVGLIRIAKREPKFEWKGRDGESSNPLFRGFQRDEVEEAHRYDEPVFIRINTKDADELSGGFPGRAEELFPHFRAIILDDVESGSLLLDQQELIDRFVAHRGGTVIMLGGQESFQGGDWEGTPLGRLLPLHLNAKASNRPIAGASLGLTREGWHESWMRLHVDQSSETNRLIEMPPFYAVNQVANPKPGASILATVTDPNQRQIPAIVTQRYGRGKSAAISIGDLWRWGMENAEQRKSLEKSWRQIIRWAVTETPTQVEMKLIETSESAADEPRVEIRVRDKSFEPLDNAHATITLKDRDGTTRHLSAEQSLDEPGMFTATIGAPKSKGYHIRTSVSTTSGDPIGTAEVARTFNPDANEFSHLGPNLTRLQEIADLTGGKLLTLDRLDELPTLISQTKVPITETITRPLWHGPWLFLIALACFLGEWSIRRRGGIF